MINLISNAPFTSSASGAAGQTFATMGKCSDTMDFALEVLLPLLYSNSTQPSAFLSQDISLVWPLQLVNKVVARSTSCPAPDGSASATCYPSWDPIFAEAPPLFLPRSRALTLCSQTKNNPISSWPASAPWAQFRSSMGHEDNTGIRSALGKTYGSGGYKLSFTGARVLSAPRHPPTQIQL
jgi:hypothetical protein